MRIRNALIILCLFILLSIKTSEVHANTTVFSDDFNDGNSNGWTLISNSCKFNNLPAVWTINNGQLGIQINGGACSTFFMPSSGSVATSSDYLIESDIKFSPSLNMDRNLIVKFQNLSNWYGLHFINNNVFLDKVVGGIEYFLPNKQFNYSFLAGQTYKIKVEIVQSQFKIYIQDQLVHIVNDISPFFPHTTAGLAASAGGVQSSEVWFDNLKIEEINNNILLNVPDLKQGQSPWGDDRYDHINKTVAEVGCTLSTAAMILRFHNHNVDPGTLNELLKNTTGGYNREGGVIWPTVAGLTSHTSAINSSLPKKNLEWLRISNATREDIKNQLSLNQPMSIRVPGHSVVGIGHEDNEILINDPWQNPAINLTNLENSRGGMQRIETFIPSDTDFSYIYLTVDENIELKVYDPQGIEITGYTFLEEPNENDLNNTVEGNTLKIFAYPKPQNGNYQIELTGSGDYLLDSYLFDQEGVINQSSFEGLIIPGQTDVINTAIGENNQSTQQIILDSTLEDLEAAYLQGLITNNKVYDLIKKRLEHATFFILRGEISSYYDSLKVALIHIKKYTPNYIDINASKVLENDINNLLEN